MGGGHAGRIVIAGAGLAGLRAAQAARQAGHDGELIIVGDERHPPYTRPPLSKELLKGEQEPARTAFPGVEKLNATLRLATAVASVDAAAHTVTLGDGETLRYDRLIVATGSRARPCRDVWLDPTAVRPTRSGASKRRDASLLCPATLRDLDDALALRDALADAEHLAIVGAGFVGCEVAASARTRGVDVTLVDVAPHPLLPLGPELGARVAALHRGHGVSLRLATGVECIGPAGLTLTDGTTVTADRVLIALGASPNTEFLAGSAIELAPDGGIVCDATLTSASDPDVLAAGDVAAWPHPAAGGERVRVEHWTTAAEHGRLAGANALLDPPERAAHVAPPYFWSDQYDCKIQSVGFPGRATEIEIVEQDADGRLVAEARDVEGELVGAVTFNHARRLAEYRRRLAVEYA